MTVDLVPEQLEAISGVTFAGAGSIITAWTDGLDSSYVVGTVDHGYVRCAISTYTLSANERFKQGRIILRNKRNVIATAQTVIGRFRDPRDNTIGTNYNFVRSTTTISDQYGPWQIVGPGGQAWAQDLVNLLRVDTYWINASGGYQVVYEVVAEFDVNQQPEVATLPVITGNDVTTRPTVTWVYSDFDDDLQTAYEIKVFSAAQYGIAGFDPDTSPHTWTSTVVSSDQQFAEVGTDLAIGTTYKIYVRAAQYWPGPDDDNSHLWWSGWQASASFTITIIPPITPTLTLTHDTVLPGYRILLDTIAPVNVLTVDEAGFEDGVGGWVSVAGGGAPTVTQSSTQARSGTDSLRLRGTASGNGSARLSGNGYSVRGGTQYTLSAYFRAGTTARSVRVEIEWRDTAGVLISTSTGSSVTDSNANFNTQATVTATSPVDAVYGNPRLTVLSTILNEDHYVDEVSFHRGATTAFTPGGYSTDASVEVQRLIKVQNFRGPSDNWVHPQLASGSGYLRDTSGFIARQSSLLESVPLTGPHPASDAIAGARAIRWRPLVGAANALDFGLAHGVVTTDELPPYMTAVISGQAMHVSVYLRGSSAVNARLLIYAVDATNAQVGSTATGSTVVLPTTTDVWTRYSVGITPGAGAVYLRGAVELTSANEDVDVYLTGIHVKLGTIVSTLTPGQGALVGTTLGLSGWETVRELDDTTPLSAGQTYTVWDHEVPPNRPVLYRARTVSLIEDSSVASAWTPTLVGYMSPPAHVLLKDPFQPENAMIVYDRPDEQVTISASEEIYEPLGRDGDPIVWRDWLSGQNGSMTLIAPTPGHLYRLAQLIVTSRPLLLQYPDGGQRYVQLTANRDILRRQLVHANECLGANYLVGVRWLEKRRP